MHLHYTARVLIFRLATVVYAWSYSACTCEWIRRYPSSSLPPSLAIIPGLYSCLLIQPLVKSDLPLSCLYSVHTHIDLMSTRAESFLHTVEFVTIQ